MSEPRKNRSSEMRIPTQLSRLHSRIVFTTFCSIGICLCQREDSMCASRSSQPLPILPSSFQNVEQYISMFSAFVLQEVHAQTLQSINTLPSPFLSTLVVIVFAAQRFSFATTPTRTSVFSTSIRSSRFLRSSAPTPSSFPISLALPSIPTLPSSAWRTDPRGSTFPFSTAW